MTKLAVYIGTTGGPIRIERITNEAAALTEVCKGRDIVALLPISDDYENFVRPGRPVERAFGPFTHPSFRMDISEEIKSGQSWYLAAFVAHGLARESRLAGPDETPAGVVWITGRVNADFGVEPVGHITEKLRAALSLFEEWAAKGVPVTVCLPQEDTAPAVDLEGVRVAAVADALEVLRDLDIPFNDGLRKPGNLKAMRSIPSTTERKGSWAPVIILVGVVLLASAGLLATDRGREVLVRLGLAVDRSGAEEIKPASSEKKASIPPMEEPKQGVAKIPTFPDETASAKEISRASAIKPTIVVYERRPPPGKTCAHVLFSDVAPVERELVPGADGDLPPSLLEGLCSLRIRYSLGDAERRGIAKLEVYSGRYVGQGGETRQSSFMNETSWSIDLPIRMDEALRFGVSVIEGEGDAERSTRLNHMVMP